MNYHIKKDIANSIGRMFFLIFFIFVVVLVSKAQNRTDPSPVYASHCWIQPELMNKDSDVDLMIYVVGLNHRQDYVRTSPDWDGATLQGVKELANFIKQDYTIPENILIISSSFTYTCDGVFGVTNGECLRRELQSKYAGSAFTILEHPDDPNNRRYGTKGVIAGNRWEIMSSNVVNALFVVVNIRERIAPHRQFAVYCLHTEDEDKSWHIKRAVRHAMESTKTSNDLVPIFAGDFNIQGLRTEFGNPNHPAYHLVRFFDIIHSISITYYWIFLWTLPTNILCGFDH